jgi:hypothetical protein
VRKIESSKRGRSRERAIRVAIVAASLGVTAIACRQIVGIGDEPPTDLAQVDEAADAGPDGIVYAGAACEACLQTHCGSQAAACAADPPCSALEGCLGACDGGQVTCRARCIAAHRIGVDPADIAISACLAGQCASPCGLTCGAFGAEFGVDAAQGCETCLLDKGCVSSQACASNPQCVGLVLCQVTNPFLDRQEACSEAFDGGSSAGSDLSTVVTGVCHDQCAAGSQWFCVGSPLPARLSTQTAMTLQLNDLLSGAPVAGATVAACSPLDPQCSADAGYLSIATSGPDGGLTLTISSGSTSGPTGYLAITAPTLTPELFYWGYPLSEPTLAEGIPVLSTSDTQAVVQLGESDGIPVDLRTHAFVGLGVLDCMHVLAPEVGISISPMDPDGGTRVVYFKGGFPSKTATQTDSSGTAVIVNVPVSDQVTITATPVALGRPSSIVSVITRPGTDTYIQLPVNQ